MPLLSLKNLQPPSGRGQAGRGTDVDATKNKKGHSTPRVEFHIQRGHTQEECQRTEEGQRAPITLKPLSQGHTQDLRQTRSQQPQQGRSHNVSFPQAGPAPCPTPVLLKGETTCGKPATRGTSSSPSWGCVTLTSQGFLFPPVPHCPTRAGGRS